MKDEGEKLLRSFNNSRDTPSISMEGKGRAFDNILTERLWRTVKYEEVHLKEYGSISEARMELSRFFEWYNVERPHHTHS